MARITTIGTGYVGLVTGAGFAKLGNDVVCLDVDAGKIGMLNKGQIPIYEPSLKERITKNKERLTFTTDYKEAVSRSDYIMICVGTPMGEEGDADLSFVFDAARRIARELSSDTHKTIITKSTVPPGTGKELERVFHRYDVDIVSNPEFLQEGKAIKNFDNPDRIVVGAESNRALSSMRQLYRPIARTGRPVIEMSRIDAEITKYAANAMLATRISFMNELSHLCERIGGDITSIAAGIGSDPRIGSRFLHAGTGYGGSCFPKDVNALIRSFHKSGLEPRLLESVHSRNEEQKLSLLPKIESLLDLKGSTVAVLGLAFKPNTDDIREAPAMAIIPRLLDKGAKVRAYDREAMLNAKAELGNKVRYCTDCYQALEGAHAAVIMTEWDEFRMLDLDKAKKAMAGQVFIDGRNIMDPDTMRTAGFSYLSVGRPEVP